MAAKLSFVPALVAGLLFPLVAQAQDRDDSELARVLAQRGWFDLAEEICDRLEKGSSKALVSYIRAEIKLGQVDREVEFEKASKGLADAVDLLKKFLADSPNHPMALEAQTSIGWVQGRKGRLAVDAVEMESDASKHADLQKMAIQAYSDAAKFYQDTIEKLKKDKSDRAQDSLMDCRLALPRIMIDHARISSVDDLSKKKLLTAANALLIDFEFDYGDRPIAFEAMLEGGKCLTELGDYKQAESKLRATFALRKRLAEAKIKPNEYHNQIIFGAYVALAQALQRAGKLNEAKTFVDNTLKEDKTLEKEWGGPALKIERAEILFKMKDVSGAMAMANEVMTKNPNSRWEAIAKDKMRRWGEGGGVSVRFSPKQMMTAADSSIDRDNYRDALRDLRRCVEACSTEAEKNEFMASAYYKMGQCFQSLRRNYEAAAAYEKVFTLFPKNEEFAAKACYETVRCYSTEFALSGDKRDDDLKEKFLSVLAANWPKNPAARNIKFVQAEKLENAGDLKGAADLYRQVTEDAEAYEAAQVRQGYCYYADASKKWEKAPKDPNVQKEVKESLRNAEDALTKFLARAADPSKAPATPEQQKARANLVQVANQQIAYIYMHEAIGKTKEALEFLAKVAKDIPADDERIAKIWATQIQAYLAQKQLDEAVKVLELMFDKYPDVPAIARACKSVAIKLDEQVGEMMKAKAEPAKINENLRKISRYYAKWLNLAPALQMRITMADVLSVAETLYMIGKQLNGLDENIISFLDLRGGKTITERQYFLDAAFVHALLTEGKVGKLPDRDRIVLMTRLSRCYSFIATDAEGWTKAKDQYENIMKTYKVMTPQGVLDGAVLNQHRELLGVYVELGYVYVELGKASKQKFQLDNASTVFSNVLRVVQGDSEPWWQSKYMVLQVLYERGAEADLKLAKVGLDNLERSNPTFDNNKYGMKDKFLELKKQINQVMGTGK
jgi:tetratricopeptide (TPR) repeat protein